VAYGGLEPTVFGRGDAEPAERDPGAADGMAVLVEHLAAHAHLAGARLHDGRAIGDRGRRLRLRFR
ncbi:MAG TPA: hypothetical protein DEF51_42895, partial [Myxococcales bacterium]|nr:hypothetical protein [Myxococcales bacterium]